MAGTGTGYLVVGGDYHDMDFARLELLKLLAEHPQIRAQVAGNYDDIEAISQCDFLISYTCNVIPSAAVQAALRQFVEGGKKWFALHATNSILRFLKDGRVDAPDEAPAFMATLGSQFLAHPPIQPFTVEKTDPTHPLVADIASFDTDDELYLSRIHGDIHTLLHATWSGQLPENWVHADWGDDDIRPVYYTTNHGTGEVLYLNLGHCRGHYDMQPMIEYYPNIERGSWEHEEFYELLRRGIAYCAGTLAT